MLELKQPLIIGTLTLGILGGSYASAVIFDDRNHAVYPEEKQTELIKDLEGDDDN